MKPAVLNTLTRGADALSQALLLRADLDIITYHDAVVPLMEARGLPCRRFSEFITEEMKARAHHEAQARCEAVARQLAEEGVGQLCPAAIGDDDAWRTLSGRVQTVLREHLFHQIVAVDALRRCADETELRVLLVQQDIGQDTRPLIEAGRRLGIPSIHIMHGYPAGAVAAINLVDGPYADVHAVFSDPVKELFLSMGVPDDRVFVTGNFEWDPHIRPPRASWRRDACARIGLDPNRPIITYALTYLHRFSSLAVRFRDYLDKTRPAVLRAFAELAARHQDWQFVVRPHPNDADAPRNMTELARREGLDTLFFDQVTPSLIGVAMSDAIVCCQSNFGMEAILAGKFVVNCVIDEFAQPYFDEGIGRLFIEDDAVLHAATPEAIAPSIEAVMLDRATREALAAKRNASIRRFNHSADGKATERVCDLVLDIVERPQSYVRPSGLRPVLHDLLTKACLDALGEDWGGGNVLVLGRDAEHIAGVLNESSPQLKAQAALGLDEAAAPSLDLIVCTDPVPADGTGEGLLTALDARLGDSGVLVLVFLNGADLESRRAFASERWSPPRERSEPASNWGQFSPVALEVFLSRAGFEADAITEQREACRAEADGQRTEVSAWVVRARRKAHVPSEWLEHQRGLRQPAVEAGARGERLLAEGKPEEALAEFAAAVEVWDASVRIHLNRAIALCSLGDREAAWDCVLNALHHDPVLPEARAALRDLAQQLGREAEAGLILSLFRAD